MDQHGVNVRIIDLRWLNPVNEKAVIDATANCASVLIVDECRHTGSQSEALMALFAEQGPAGRETVRITADDSFIPLGRAATVTLPSRDDIIEACIALSHKH